MSDDYGWWMGLPTGDGSGPEAPKTDCTHDGCPLDHCWYDDPEWAAILPDAPSDRSVQ